MGGDVEPKTSSEDYDVRRQDDAPAPSSPTADYDGVTGGLAGLSAAFGESPNNGAKLVSNRALSLSVNSNVRGAALRHVQRSYGNHFVQRALIQRKTATAPPIQRQCACGGTCPTCRASSTLPAASIQPKTENSTASPSQADEKIIPEGGGEPLDKQSRESMESRFHHDFEDVRVHTDEKAANSAVALSANAYTHGRDIYFSPGKYAPHTTEGRALLAHELTHTIQQSNGLTPTQGTVSPEGVTVSSPNDPLEREADQIAAQEHTSTAHEISHSSDARPQISTASIGVQRQPDAGTSSTALTPPGTSTGAAPASSSSTVTELRDAMGEVSPVAGVGNWPKAFGILNGLSMHDLLRTIDALNAGEREQLIWNKGAGLNFNMVRILGAFDAVRQARDPNITEDDLNSALWKDLSSEDQTAITDFIRGIKAPLRETAALTQAGRFKPTGTSHQDVLQQMQLIQHNIASAEADAALMGIATRLEPVKYGVDQRKERFGKDPEEISKWNVQVAGQLDIVRRSALAISFVRQRFEATKKAAKGEVPEYVRKPLNTMAEAYVAAIRTSDLIGTGYERLAVADDLANNLEVAIMEAMLDAADQMFIEAKKLSKGRTDLVGLSQQQYREDLKKLRELIKTDPAKAVEEIKHMQEHVTELFELATVVHTTAQFDGLHADMEKMMKECLDQDFFTNVAELLALKTKLQPYRDHWHTLQQAYFPPSKTAQDAAWTVIKGESESLTAQLTLINEAMERAAKKLKWAAFFFRIFILAIIAVLTMGVGIALTGVAAAWELGTVGTFLLVSGGEAFFFTAATTLLLEKDRSLGKFVQQFLLNWATFGAMRGLSALYRGVFGVSKTLPGVVAEAIFMLGTSSIVSLGLADLEKRRRTGQGLTMSEAAEIVAEGVIVGVITMVAGRVGKDMLPEVYKSGFRAGQKLKVINAMRRSLAQRCSAIIGKPPTQIAATPTTPPKAGQPVAAEVHKPKTMEQAQQVLEEDAALIKQEEAVLKELDVEASRDPTSPEAQNIKKELAANAEASQKNEAMQVASVLEDAGPNDMLCEQGRLDQVEAYHKKNDKVTVSSGVAENGARKITVTPKDPVDGAPFTITEKLTPGAEPVITKAPEPIAPDQPVPAESQYKPISELLTEDGTAFKDQTLNEGYQKYKAKKERAKEKVKTPEEWARSQTSSHYRKPLETQLGKDFFKQGGAKINIRDKPRPRDYTPDRYLADEAAVRPHIAKVLRAAGVDPAQGIPGGEISVSAFNGAKGVATEILARDIQADVLAEVRKTHPNAFIIRGLRMRIMKAGQPGQAKQFTDAVIGYFEGNDLKLAGRFEVKSGPTGGQEATVQFFEWVERRIEPGSLLVLPDGRMVAYGPTAQQRAQGIGSVSGLMNAKTYIIAPEGAEHLGRGSEMQTVTTHERIPLKVTAEQIEYVTRLLLEPYITAKAPVTLVTPMVQPTPAVQPTVQP